MSSGNGPIATVPELNGEEKPKVKREDLVTPWEVATTSDTGIDYDKLIGVLFVSCINLL